MAALTGFCMLRLTVQLLLIPNRLVAAEHFQFVSLDELDLRVVSCMVSVHVHLPWLLLKSCCVSRISNKNGLNRYTCSKEAQRSKRWAFPANICVIDNRTLKTNSF